MSLTLVLGGARSGKSLYAESLAHGNKTYIATAEAFDEEMTERIARHRNQRGDGWATIEAPLELAAVLSNPSFRRKPESMAADLRRSDEFVLVDCITVWIGNLMHHERDIRAEVARLCDTLRTVTADIVVVSNEVGLSVVPENAMARRFRDEQGLANQRIAEIADRVVFLAAGLPLVLKG